VAHVQGPSRVVALSLPFGGQYKSRLQLAASHKSQFLIQPNSLTTILLAFQPPLIRSRFTINLFLGKMSVSRYRRLQEEFSPQMESLAHSLVEKSRESKSFPLAGILPLSDLMSGKLSGTLRNISESIIVETTITAVWDAICESSSPDSPYLVMRPKSSVGTLKEPEPTSTSSSRLYSDLVSKTLVLHNGSFDVRLRSILENAGLEEIRLKSCDILSETLDLVNFTKLERLHMSLAPSTSCSIVLPPHLQELLVYMNEFNPTKRKFCGFQTLINAERCGSLKRM
jgi:hypothetical protein